MILPDAVICPFDFNIKSPSESLISVEDIVKTAVIFPPLNNTDEPVICPLDLIDKLSFELDMQFQLIQPISPFHLQ